MKCVLMDKFGEASEVLTMSSEWPKPTLKPEGGQMLVRVEACSLSAGDSLFVSGVCSKFMQPEKFPCIPGMDICGIVEEIADGEKFKVGDRVLASNGLLPVGGLAECMAVDIKNAALVPSNVDSIGAAALPNSPMAAMLTVRKARIKAGDRVMLLGGSGGVGTSLVQLLKDAGASFVATTSTDEPLMRSLGADVVVNYRETNWWEMEDFKKEPFDVVIDCVGWRDEWQECRRTGALKASRNGGRYLPVAFTDRPRFTTIWEGLRMFLPVLWRTLWTYVYPWVPSYAMIMCEPEEKDWGELTKLVAEGRLKPVLTPSSPYPFTLEGVKQAFQLQDSRHAHGKVVVKIAEATG